MSQENELLEDGLPQLPPGEPAKPGSAGRNPMMLVLMSLRRHWLLVLAIWVLLGAPSTIFLWTKIRPTYTASAHVEFSQAVPKVMYDDPESTIMPGFDSFLNTQVKQISSTQVLRAALADPTVQGLLLDPDPLPVLRSMLTVEALSRTNLLRVSVSARSPDVAIKLASAIMRAYETFEKDNSMESKRTNYSLLKKKHEQLGDVVEALNKQINERAMVYGVSEPIGFVELRKAKLEANARERQELGERLSERTRLENQLKQLQDGVVPTTMPGEEVRIREEEIEKDPTVAALKRELADIAYKIVHQGSAGTLLEKKRKLEEDLTRETARAAKAADNSLGTRRVEQLDIEKDRVKKQLVAINETIKTLQEHVDAEEKAGLVMGQTGEYIRQLNEELASNKKQYDEIGTKLYQLDIEKWRPARISLIDPQAEILPDGITDKRFKLVPVSILGPLALGVLLAFLIDFLSSRIYTAQDVEHGAGLRLLGSLPSLEDLKRQRVTQEDFRESYRLIRATLAGLSPDGKIPKTLLVTSAKASEGKTSLAVSLAASLAEAGERVLVIDGDVQAPRVGQALRLKLPFGLRHVLLGERQLSEAVGVTPVPSLEVLLSGRNGSSALGLLNARLAARLVKMSAKEYDHVVIDSPPVLGSENR